MSNKRIPDAQCSCWSRACAQDAIALYQQLHWALRTSRHVHTRPEVNMRTCGPGPSTCCCLPSAQMSRHVHTNEQTWQPLPLPEQNASQTMHSLAPDAVPPIVAESPSTFRQWCAEGTCSAAMFLSQCAGAHAYLRQQPSAQPALVLDLLDEGLQAINPVCKAVRDSHASVL